MSLGDPQHPIHPEHIPLLAALFSSLGIIFTRIKLFVRRYAVELVFLAVIIQLALTISIFLMVNETLHKLER